MLSFYHVGPRDSTQVIGLGCKCLQPLSPLPGHTMSLFTRRELIGSPGLEHAGKGFKRSLIEIKEERHEINTKILTCEGEEDDSVSKSTCCADVGT